MIKFKDDHLLITQPPHYCLLKVIILYIKGAHVPTGTSNQKMSIEIKPMRMFSYDKNIIERGSYGYIPSDCGVQGGCARGFGGDTNMFIYLSTHV